jgi:glycosyltransferase involved in cell wall biosynthesis
MKISGDKVTLSGLLITHRRPSPSVSAPVRIAIVDVAQPLADLDLRHPSGGTYKAVWVLAMRGERPIGIATIPVSSETLCADDLERHLRESLGEAFDLDMCSTNLEVALPRASVIVATNVGRPEQLKTAVERLGELDYPEYEILVIDNRRSGGVNDQVLAAMASLPRVRVLAERRPGTSVARNRGLWAATGEIVAFTDDDDEVDRNWLRVLGGRLASPGVDAVCGLAIPMELETPAQLWFEQSGRSTSRCCKPLRFELASPRAGVFRRERFEVVRHSQGEPDTLASVYATGEYGTGCNMAFRTEVLRGLGGLDPALGGGSPTHAGEDCALFIRLLMSGGSVAYEPAAILHRGLRRDLDDLEKQMYTYGVGFMAALMSLVWEDPSHIIGLLRLLPTAVRSLVSPSSPRRVDRVKGYPFSLTKAELLGTLAGPFAYVLSRTQRRKWSL